VRKISSLNEVSGLVLTMIFKVSPARTLFAEQ